MVAVRRRAKIYFLITIFVIVNLFLFIVYDKAYKTKYYFDKTNEEVLSKKKDWNDYVTMKASLNQTGPGENGAPVLFAEFTKALYDMYGFEVALSDMISLNRTVPDVRYEDCKSRTYLSKLPKSTFIIVCYNERLSTLLRTVYSLLNRTPAELIQEIIIVDDGSTWADLQAPLDDFLQKNLPPKRSKVRLLRLQARKGLMVARMEGARNASKDSEVLVFLDSHFEMMYNWLPPLLEPIALNPKCCAIPSLDRIHFDTFEYSRDGELRGYWSWAMDYQIRPLQPDEQKHPSRNFPAYAMMGGALAIRADFFWELGGFDEGMLFWGGEQYELSFKVWMCGGELINVPCSRLGHLYRDPKTKGNTNLYDNYSFMDRNIRRLIDVWFDDEHRQYVLNHRPNSVNVDTGDLTERFALRDRLQCKSFSWMMDTIMPDMKRIFPPVESLDFGNGAIRYALNPDLCIALDTKNKKRVVLQKCNIDDWRHVWTYSWRCELKTSDICLEADVYNQHANSFECHLLEGNQKWFYDTENHWMVISDYNLCMSANLEKQAVDMAKCVKGNEKLIWKLDSYNATAVEKCRNTAKD